MRFKDFKEQGVIVLTYFSGMYIMIQNEYVYHVYFYYDSDGKYHHDRLYRSELKHIENEELDDEMYFTFRGEIYMISAFQPVRKCLSKKG